MPHFDPSSSVKGSRGPSPLGDLGGFVVLFGGVVLLARLSARGYLTWDRIAPIVVWLDDPLHHGGVGSAGGVPFGGGAAGLPVWLLLATAAACAVVLAVRLRPRRGRPRSLAAVVARAERSKRPRPVVVGTTPAGVVRLSDSERASHGLDLGTPGQGKSSLAVSLAAQIACRRDETIVVVDPHATLVDDLLGYLPARLRSQGVLLLEAAAPDWVYGISPLYCPPGDDPALRARAAADAHRTLYGDSWSDRIHHHVTHLFQSLIEAGYSYLEAPRVLQDTIFRQHVAGLVKSPAARAWFRELAGKNQSQLQGEIASVYVRISEMVASSTVRGMLGPLVRNPIYTQYLSAQMPGYTPRELDLEAVLTSGAPLLACLSRHDLGGYSTRLSALLLAQLADSVFRRDATLAAGPMRAATFFLDELQSYASSSVIDAFQQARKFGCSVLGICTSLETMEPAVARALRSARMLICFGCIYNDAAALVGDMFTAHATTVKYHATPAAAPLFFSGAEMRDAFTDRLTKCPPRHFYLYTRERRTDAVLVRALTVTRRGSAAERAALQDRSGQRWGNPRPLVEQELALREDWLDRRLYLAAPAAVGSSRPSLASSGAPVHPFPAGASPSIALPAGCGPAPGAAAASLPPPVPSPAGPLTHGAPAAPRPPRSGAPLPPLTLPTLGPAGLPASPPAPAAPSSATTRAGIPASAAPPPSVARGGRGHGAIGPALPPVTGAQTAVPPLPPLLRAGPAPSTSQVPAPSTSPPPAAPSDQRPDGPFAGWTSDAEEAPPGGQTP